MLSTVVRAGAGAEAVGGSNQGLFLDVICFHPFSTYFILAIRCLLNALLLVSATAGWRIRRTGESRIYVETAIERFWLLISNQPETN